MHVRKANNICSYNFQFPNGFSLLCITLFCLAMWKSTFNSLTDSHVVKEYFGATLGSMIFQFPNGFSLLLIWLLVVAAVAFNSLTDSHNERAMEWAICI